MHAFMCVCVCVCVCERACMQVNVVARIHVCALECAWTTGCALRNAVHLSARQPEHWELWHPVRKCCQKLSSEWVRQQRVSDSCLCRPNISLRPSCQQSVPSSQTHRQHGGVTERTPSLQHRRRHHRTLPACWHLRLIVCASDWWMVPMSAVSNLPAATSCISLFLSP